MIIKFAPTLIRVQYKLSGWRRLGLNETLLELKVKRLLRVV